MALADLVITFLQVRSGDAILIELPDGGWGTVDAPPERTVAEIGQRGQMCRFVCLSHPHADHYMGLSAFLTRLLEKGAQPAFWDFGARQLSSFRPFLTESSLSFKSLPREKQELIRLYQKVMRMSKQGRIRYAPVQPGTILAEDKSAGWAICGLFPDRSALDRYDRFLGDAVRKRRLTLRGLDHNRVATVLEVRWGSTRILLSSDAASGLRGIAAGQNEVAVVQVPHHGSNENRTHSEWRHLGRGDLPIPAPISNGPRYRGAPSSGVLDALSHHRLVPHCAWLARACFSETSARVRYDWSVSRNLPCRGDVKIVLSAATQSVHVQCAEANTCARYE